jgi:hypothetical protein
MKIYTEITPTVLRPALVAPIFGGSVAGVCPQAGFRRADAHTQVNPWIEAGMATGYRSWSSLIT